MSLTLAGRYLEYYKTSCHICQYTSITFWKAPQRDISTMPKELENDWLENVAKPLILFPQFSTQPRTSRFVATRSLRTS